MADSEITDSQLSERARKAPPPKRALTNGVRPRTKPRIAPASQAATSSAARTAPKRTAPKRKVKASQRARAAPAKTAPARMKRPAKVAAKSTAKRTAKVTAKSPAKRIAKVTAKSPAKRTAKVAAKKIASQTAAAAAAQSAAAEPLRPKVSVVIPTYNRARWLPDAVECIRKQTLTNWELFIVDDGSTDNTREVAESYAKQDKRIHYVHQPHHGGPAAGLNRVLPKLRGDYLYKHDDDDVASPEKVSKCTAWMDANPNGFAVRVRFQDDRYRANDNDGKVTTKFFNGIPLFYRIYMLREIGGWNEFYPIIEDSDMLMRAAERGWSEGEVDEVLYTYRRVEENRRQVSNALQLLGYRLILYRSQLLRQWGLPDLTRHSSSFRRLLRFCYARRRAYLPRALEGHWQKSLRLDVPTDPDMNELWSAQCTPMRGLTHQKPRFPWAPLWSVWAYAAGFMRSAHMPWRMRLPIFRHIARGYYFDWRSKQLAQDRFAFRQRNDILGMARSQSQLRMPQVSVGLVTCRADKGQAARVRRALDSIAAQSLKNWELLVLDNRSTAETRRLLEARAKSEPRLRLMRGVRPLALADGLNSLLAHARGQFFCRQDEAGESHPQRLKSSAAWLQRHPHAYALSTEVDIRNGTRTRACPHRMPLFLRMGVADYLQGWRALGQVLDEPNLFPLAEDTDMRERMRIGNFSCGHLAKPLYAVDAERAGPRLQSTPASSAYQLLLQQDEALHGYGLTNLYQQTQSRARLLGVIHGGARLLPRLPQIRMRRWSERDNAAWQRLAHIRYRLRKQPARFPYRALWVALGRTHRMMARARMPWGQRTPLFWHLVRAFVRSLRVKPARRTT